MDVVVQGRLVFKTISRDESLEVSRAVDALLQRRSVGLADGGDSLVIGELKVRIHCEPPHLPPHVTIKPAGALGKRVRSWMPLKVSRDFQRENLPDIGASLVERGHGVTHRKIA